VRGIGADCAGPLQKREKEEGTEYTSKREEKVFKGVWGVPGYHKKASMESARERFEETPNGGHLQRSDVTKGRFTW